MRGLKSYRTVILGTAFWLQAICGCQAAAITIGTADSTNAMPFEDVTRGTYQQIYASSDFGTTPQSLTAVTFLGPNGFSITSATYTLDLSTTTAGIGNYTLYQLGANNIQEFSGTLGGPITGGSFTIPFTQAFSYNPNAGNLLLQISISGGPTNPGGLGLYTMSNGGNLFSRAYNVYSGAVNINSADSTGLVTQFDTAASSSNAPEPGSLFLMGMSLIGGVLVMRRLQRRTEAKPVATGILR
jgi:PEP-CTERM motif